MSVIGETLGTTRTVNHRKIPLLQHDCILWPSGHLLVSVSDQIDYLKHVLSRLSPRQCIVLIGSDQARLMTVQYVQEIGSPKWREYLAAKFCEYVWQQHDCFFVPKLEIRRWNGITGSNGSNGSSPRSKRIPARRGNSSEKGSSLVDRLRRENSKGSGNGGK